MITKVLDLENKDYYDQTGGDTGKIQKGQGPTRHR